MRRKLLHFTFFLASIFITPDCSKTTIQSSPNPQLPVLSTSTVTGITTTTAVGGGVITEDGGASVTARGVCWSTTEKPTTLNNKTSDSSGTGIINSLLTGLTANTIYFVRAYAINSVGTAYGNEVSFKSLQIGLPVVVSAPVYTNPAYTNGTTTAQSGGYITSDGGSTITTRGVCWGVNHNPTITDSATHDGVGTGAFNSLLTGLKANTTYFARAYATNSGGTGYGGEDSFTSFNNVPLLLTNNAVWVTPTAVQCGGNISSDNGVAITSRGVCWSVNPLPTTADSVTHDGTGTGSFISSLTNLTANTVYYIRAYATSAAGTGYGYELIFSSQAPVGAVSLSLHPSDTIGTASLYLLLAMYGTYDRGVYLSTNPIPDSGNTLIPYSITRLPCQRCYHPTYNYEFKNLISGTTYYARAFARNYFWIWYGNILSFTAQ